MGRSSSESSSSSNSSTDDSDTKPPPSSDGDASSAEEDFVVQEKKHGRIRQEEESPVRTKKSHNVGRKYRKQDEDSDTSSASSGSDSDDEVNTRKRRMMSSIVVSKVSHSTAPSSSEEERTPPRKHRRRRDSGAEQRVSKERVQHDGLSKDARSASNRNRREFEDRVDDSRDYAHKSKKISIRHERYANSRRRNDEKHMEYSMKEEKVKSEEESDEETKPKPNRTYKDNRDEKRHIKKESVKEERGSGRHVKQEIKEEPGIEMSLSKDRKRHKDRKPGGREQVKREEDDMRTHRNGREKNQDRRGNNKMNTSGWGQTESGWEQTESGWGQTESTAAASTATTTATTTTSDSKPAEKEKENFGLSGKLTEYTNTYNGVVIIYNEPPEARKPKTKWRFYPFKGDKSLTMLQLHRQSAFLLGRDRTVADIPVDHPSCSKQHAVLQFRLVPFEKADGDMGKKVKPYIIDLDSRNGTHVNNNRIEARKYVELRERDVIKFGFSSRDYVLLHEKSEDVDSADDQGEGETVETK